MFVCMHIVYTCFVTCLTREIDKKWLKINELTSLDWAAADIPIIDKLIANG